MCFGHGGVPTTWSDPKPAFGARSAFAVKYPSMTIQPLSPAGPFGATSP